MGKPVAMILIGSSLTEASDELVRVGLALARAAGARLAVAHAADTPDHAAVGPSGYGWFDPQIIETHLGAQRERLAAQLARLGVPGEMLVTTRVETGPADVLLTDEAGAVQADLIVVGATERGPVMRLLGSTADHVARQASCPVLIVREGLAVPPRHVLVPVDLSHLSTGALAWAGGLLDQLCPGHWPPVQVLLVLERLEQLVTQFTPEQMTRFAREELEGFVEHALGPRDHLPEIHVMHGDPRDEILAAAAAQAADLVVMATHGRRGLDRLAMGSVAADIARRAGCSVLLVPPAVADAVARNRQALEFDGAAWRLSP